MRTSIGDGYDASPPRYRYSNRPNALSMEAGSIARPSRAAAFEFLSPFSTYSRGVNADSQPHHMAELSVTFSRVYESVSASSVWLRIVARRTSARVLMKARSL